MADRISFTAFLDFPDPLPDSRMIWLFRAHGREKNIVGWTELERQLDSMGLRVMVSEKKDRFLSQNSNLRTPATLR
jgi:IS5 family transposase